MPWSRIRILSEGAGAGCGKENMGDCNKLVCNASELYR